MAAAYLTIPACLLLLCYILICSTTLISSATQENSFDLSANCPHILTPSTLKLNSTREKSTLRILVPWKVGFHQFVSFSPYSCRLDGFSIQVFREALSYMQYIMPPAFPPYQFVLYGTGTHTFRYDDMIDMLLRKEVDAVVGDLTITKERLQKVGFTVPYLVSSSLVMLTPFSYGSIGTLWDFLKPFSNSLWITLLGFFMATGFVLYFLEDQNPDFAMTSKKSERESQQATSHGDSSKQTKVTSTSNPVLGNTSPPSSTSTSTCDPRNLPCHMASDHGSPLPLPLENNSSNLINDDISSLQGLGPPIYDQASHMRRAMNAYWYVAMC